MVTLYDVPAEEFIDELADRLADRVEAAPKPFLGPQNEEVGMSNSPDDDRLEELREQKRKELEQQRQGGSQQDQEAQEAAQQQAEAQKEAMLKQHLTDGARQRLNAVQMSKPEFADKVEQQIIALARSGRVQDRIDEDQMKALLKELQPESKSFDIQRR